MEAIEHPPIFRIPGVPDHVLYMWVAMLILIGVAWAGTRRAALVPRGAQNFVEVILEQIIQMIEDVIGHEGRRYLPLIGTLGLFILVSNLMGLVPGLMSPTSNLMTNAACAIIVFVSYHYIGIKKQGLKHYLNHFSGPMEWSWGMAPIKLIMIPIETISHLARPLSLTLRLFGNIVGGHILLSIIFLLMGLQGLIGWALSGSVGGAVVGGVGGIVMIVFTVGFLYPLKILVSFLQAFIFVMLTMLYIAGAVEGAEHDEHHDHAEPHQAHH